MGIFIKKNVLFVSLLLLLKSLICFSHIVDLERIKAIDIIDITSESDMSLVSRNFLDINRIKNADEFWLAVSHRYDEIHDKLKKQWKINNDNLLKTVFFMNLTANLWGYGNKIATDKVGCVCNNEINGHQFDCSSPFENHVEEYIYSSIGCCIDQSRVLHFLLSKANITNRYMLNPGHIFVEAYLGSWNSFDPTTNMWWHDSWQSIQNADIKSHVKVSIFPVYGTVEKHPFYRQFLGVFRHYMLLEAVYKMAKDIKYTDNI